MKARHWLALGALGGLLAVALGALAAHGLQAAATADPLRLFDKAVRYQALHSLALLFVGLLLREAPRQPLLQGAGAAFLAGILLFSGSLYLKALNVPLLPALATPLGGLSFLAGWALLLAGCLKLPERD